MELVGLEPNFRAAVGIHPTEYQELLEREPGLTLLESAQRVETDLKAMQLMVTNPQVVAIGETGLDYFRLPDDLALQNRIKQLQQAAFIQHINLANQAEKVLVVHVRDKRIPEAPTEGNAYWDTLRLLQQYHEGTRPFILHCVSGPVEYVRRAVNMDAYFGVAGNVTYKNADQIRGLIRSIPRDHLLSETDAPFLPPQEYRGQMCEPWMIARTVEFLAEELGVEPTLLYQTATKLLFQ